MKCYFHTELTENVWNKANLDHQMNGLPELLPKDIIIPCMDIKEAAVEALVDLLTQFDTNSFNTIVN